MCIWILRASFFETSFFGLPISHRPTPWVVGCPSDLSKIKRKTDCGRWLVCAWMICVIQITRGVFVHQNCIITRPKKIKIIINNASYEIVLWQSKQYMNILHFIVVFFPTLMFYARVKSHLQSFEKWSLYFGTLSFRDLCFVRFDTLPHPLGCHLPLSWLCWFTEGRVWPVVPLCSPTPPPQVHAAAPDRSCPRDCHRPAPYAWLTVWISRYLLSIGKFFFSPRFGVRDRQIIT